jgi:hypothetical protein
MQMLTPRDLANWPEKKRQPLTFSRKTRSFFSYYMQCAADENFNAVPRPANGKPTLVQSTGQMSASSVRIFPASEWDARKEPNR